MLKPLFEIQFVFDNGEKLKTTRPFSNITELEGTLSKDVITYQESDGYVVKVFRNKLNMITYKEL